MTTETVIAIVTTETATVTVATETATAAVITETVTATTVGIMVEIAMVEIGIVGHAPGRKTIERLQSDILKTVHRQKNTSVLYYFMHLLCIYPHVFAIVVLVLNPIPCYCNCSHGNVET